MTHTLFGILCGTYFSGLFSVYSATKNPVFQLLVLLISAVILGIIFTVLMEEGFNMFRTLFCLVLSLPLIAASRRAYKRWNIREEKSDEE